MQAARAASGYSGTPPAAKRGLKDAMVAAFIALPASLAWLASAVRFAEVARGDDLAAVAAVRRYDCIHGFTRRRAEIEAHLAVLQHAIRKERRR